MKKFLLPTGSLLIVLLALSPMLLTQTTVNKNGGASLGIVTVADNGLATLGAKANDKSSATNTTAVSAMSVLKYISYMLQNPASQPSTIVDGGSVTTGAKADAKSTATDTTPVTMVQLLKQISYMLQNPAVTPIAYTAGGTIAASDTANTVESTYTPAAGLTNLNATAQTAYSGAKVLVDLQCTNTSADTMAFVLFYDTTGSVTVGTTAYNTFRGVPFGGGTIGFTKPISFTTGLKVASITTLAGSTASAANTVACSWAVR